MKTKYTSWLCGALLAWATTAGWAQTLTPTLSSEGGYFSVTPEQAAGIGLHAPSKPAQGLYISNKLLRTKFDKGLSVEMAREVVGEVFQASERHAVPPEVILAIIEKESQFDRNTRSPYGSVGLMQIIPRWHRDKIQQAGGTSAQLMQNTALHIEVGVQVLKEALARSNGNMVNALARYNGSLGSRRGVLYANSVLHKAQHYRTNQALLVQLQEL